MNILEALENTKDKYKKMTSSQKREITKLVTGSIRHERAILNSKDYRKED